MIDYPALITAIAVVLTALGAKEAIQGYMASRNGKAQAEKDRNKELIERVEKYQKEAEEDREAMEHQYSINRILKEYASELRRKMIDAGIPASEIPPWPSMERNSSDG